MTIIEALTDKRLFGALPAFQDLSTWRDWLVFLAAVYGLALSSLRDVGLSEAEALRVFSEHTGRSRYHPPDGGYPETVGIISRQSGKTRAGATIQGYEAMTATPEPDGTELYCVSVAQDQRASLRTLFRYAAAPFDRVPVLSRAVVTRRAGTLRPDRSRPSVVGAL